MKDFNFANDLKLIFEKDLIEDFINFSKSIDNVKKTYNCSEEDAIEIVSKLWDFNIDKIKEKKEKKPTTWKYTVRIDGVELILYSKKPNLKDRIEDIRKQFKEVAFKKFDKAIKDYFSEMSTFDSFDDYIKDCALAYEDFITDWSPVCADEFEECEDNNV